MADLPDAWHEIDGPAREALDFWISGDGGDRWDVFQIKDELGNPCDLDGCTIEAEIRNDADDLVAALEAEIVTPASGDCRVKCTAAISAGMGEALLTAMPRGGKTRLGTYAVFITDSAGRWPIKAGDAFGIRK